MSLFEDKVQADQIPVYKRPSGGESVILTPQTLIISVRLIDPELSNPHVYFKQINSLLIKELSELGIADLSYKGISDIAIGNKKILGSSIYRKRDLVFYHAVLNISESLDQIAYYLAHPQREPDYRKGRNHTDFVTSLHQAGYPVDASTLQMKLNPAIHNFLMNGSEKQQTTTLFDL